MKSRLPILVALALVLGACAPGDEGVEPTQSVATQPDDAPTATTPPSDAGDGEPTTTAAEPPPPTSDRPLAPDFTLELGDGGTYTLSEGSKPVYLIFWAEW